MTNLHRANEDFARCLTEASRADLHIEGPDGGTGRAVFDELQSCQFRLLRLVEPFTGPARVSDHTGRMPGSSPLFDDVYGDHLAQEFRSTARHVEEALSAVVDSDPDHTAELESRHVEEVLEATKRLQALLGLS